MSYTPGYMQIAILRTCSNGNWFQADKPSHRRSSLRLHDNGFLDRDPKNSRRFTCSAKGDAWIKAHDAALPKVPA